jgi:proteasome accessory factor B
LKKPARLFAGRQLFSAGGIAEQLWSSRRNEKIRVVIRFDEVAADYIREKKWHASQKLRDLPKGAVELEMTLSSLVEVERWVLSWGGHAKVLRPKELVESVRAFGRAIASAHSR